MVILNSLQRNLKAVNSFIRSLKFVIALPNPDCGKRLPMEIILLPGDVDTSLVEVGSRLVVFVCTEEHLGEIIITLNSSLFVLLPIILLSILQLILQLIQLFLFPDFICKLHIIHILVLYMLIVLLSRLNQHWHGVINNVKEINVRMNESFF